ncbi:MAG: hypothetical protein HYU66_14640 [Armatimonadetes bacterium]|nr:hypothetical protein [Armatimonadota bacterium]
MHDTVAGITQRLSSLAGADEATRRGVADEAQTLRAEAEAAVDKELALAPKQPAPRIDRIGLRMFVELVGAATTNREIDFVAMFLQPATLADMWAAAELDAHNRTRLISAVWLQLMCSMKDHQGDIELTRTALLPLLAPAARGKVEWARQELEDLTREADPQTAGLALASLGFYAMIGEADFDKALDCFHRAAERDPALVSPHLLSAGLMLMRHRYADVLVLADQRRKVIPGGFWHLVAAKAALELKQLDQAGERFDDAVKAEPEDLRGRVGHVALLLYRAGAPDQMERAKAALADLRQRAGDHPNEELALDLLACDIAVDLLEGRVAEARRSLIEGAARGSGHRALVLLREAAGL